MTLDSNFCLAYDRRPASFLNGAGDHSASRSFHDIMHGLQELQVDWQATSSTEPRQLLESTVLDRYMDAIANIENHADKAMGTLQQATQIPARIEQLFYQLHMSYFKAQIYRLTAVSTSIATPKRLSSFAQMKASLETVISSFMTLKQLSAVPNVAWDVQQAAMTSALILAGLDRAFGTQESLELLEKFSRTLPHCSVPDDEAENMMKASYCHGLEALKFVLDAVRGHASILQDNE